MLSTTLLPLVRLRHTRSKRVVESMQEQTMPSILRSIFKVAQPSHACSLAHTPHSLPCLPLPPP
jgi:hypothetical protein